MQLIPPNLLLSLNSNPSPIRRTKEPPRSTRIRIRDPHRRIQIIRIIRRNADPPPTCHIGVRQIQCQNNDNRADRQPDIQARRRNIVEAHPPTAVAVPDVFVEDVAHNAPGKVVEGCRGGKLAGATEDERHGDVFDGRFGEHARQYVDDDGGHDPCEPKPLEVLIETADGENALGADEPPDDGGVEEDAAIGTVELVGLVFGADVGDGAAESPFQNADLHNTGPEGGNGLGHEHGAGRDLHVLADFQILGEVETLSHCDVAVRLEKHHSYGTTWLYVARDEFAEMLSDSIIDSEGSSVLT